MSTPAPALSQIAAQWREARRLYRVYSALLERYALGLPPCRELESPVDRADPQVIAKVWNWFGQMDERVHVHQLRQLMQTTRLGTEDNLRALIQHHLAKKEKTEADRDKIDFLLVQYLSTCAPPGLYDRDITFEDIAQVLEPLLGEVGQHPPDWLKPLETATKSLDQLSSLRDLLENRTLDQMRKLKAGGGDMYFGPTALVAITRFNFMVRRTFVRLIAADLSAVRSALHELEARGIQTVDCSRAKLGRQEPLESLKQTCADWKKPFRAAYAAGQNFRELVEIRIAVERALAGPQAEEPVASDALTEDAFEVRGVETRHAASPAGGHHVPFAVQAGYVDADGDAGAGSNAEEPVRRFERFDRFGGADVESTDRNADTEFAAALAHVHSAQPSAEIPVETPSSIAAQLFSGAADSSAVNWQPVGDEVDEPPPPPKPKPGAAPTGGADEAAAEVLTIEQTAASIAEQLQANSVKPGAVATITAPDMKLLLSSWEVGAFIAGETEVAKSLQRVVAARAILVQQIERKKRTGNAAAVKSAVNVSRQEIKNTQDRIAAAKKAKDIDGAVNLAATCKRLQTLIGEAEKARY